MKKSLLPLKQPVVSSSSRSLLGKEDLENLLKQYFGHSQFRGRQLEAIQAVLSGRDCFCLMPTGGGKSMCYQIPALAKPGIVLVISPLIALMENQVMMLKEKRIPAEYLSSTQMPQVKAKIHEDIDCCKPSIKLLYVTPELVATLGFKSKLAKLHGRGLLSLIAIDEAHCISTWGHDFRPTYRKLSSLRSHLPDVPILALTATAVPKVQKDVVESLGLHHPLVLRASFNRPNIYYEVRYKDVIDDVYSDLTSLIKSSGHACSIVYCLERSTCDDLSSHLAKNGIPCAAYHAGLTNKVRSTVLDDWLSSRIQVVVATVAFGMGIDRKDVRFVCHFNIPKSMESFYQESGRAGRDQLPSRSLLYYGQDDRRRMEFILSNAGSKKSQSSSSSDALLKKSLADFTQMVEYCEGSNCRRKKILESFGEKVPVLFCRKMCDACKHPHVVTAYLEELRNVSSTRQKYGFSPVFIKSLLDTASKGQETEFWNREDEASASDEDISDPDDGSELVHGLAMSKVPSKARPSDRIDVLQRAEEIYYQNTGPKKQKLVGVLSDKKAISDTLREASKQRLLNALKQAQSRLGNLICTVESSAALLEIECYKKYEKVGKTFYNSQVASTVRWLSSSSYEEINGRLSSIADQVNINCRSDSVSMVSSTSADKDPAKMGANAEETNVIFPSETSSKPLLLELPSQNKELPPIPSFSKYVNQKRKGSQSDDLRLSGQNLSASSQKRAADVGMKTTSGDANAAHKRLTMQ